MYQEKQVRSNQSDSRSHFGSAFDDNVQSKFRAPPPFADPGDDPTRKSPIEVAANSTPMALQRKVWQEAANASAPVQQHRLRIAQGLNRPVQLVASSGFPTIAIQRCGGDLAAEEGTSKKRKPRPGRCGHSSSLS